LILLANSGRCEVIIRCVYTNMGRKIEATREQQGATRPQHLG
jgi:hypothetical protein